MDRDHQLEVCSRFLLRLEVDKPGYIVSAHTVPGLSLSPSSLRTLASWITSAGYLSSIRLE